jgi:hypothetical protein
MRLVLSIAAFLLACNSRLVDATPSPESQTTTPPSPLLHILFYETQDFHEHSSHVQTLLSTWSHVDPSLVQAQIVGQGTSFEGYGSKYAAVYPILKALPHDDGRLVVLSDSRDVLINAPSTSVSTTSTSMPSLRAHSLDVQRSIVEQAVRDFVDRHARLTQDFPDALVVSAEAQCCVSALTFVQPGDYYDQFGTRNARACASGEADCLWQGDAYAVPWQSYMQGLAVNRTSGGTGNAVTTTEDVYLNAGLMVGTVPNLLRVLEQAQIGKDEDDQAVLTDFMYHHPNAILLDYHQELFGNNRGGLIIPEDQEANAEDAQCVFDWSPDDAHHAGRLVHTKTKTSPLFVHSPGGFLDCQDRLAMKLGLFDATEMAIRQERRKLHHHGDSSRALCNYGGGCGCHDNYRGGCNGCGGCNGGGGDGYYPPPPSYGGGGGGGGYDGGDEYPNKHQLFVNIGIGAHYQNNLDRGKSGGMGMSGGKMGSSGSSDRGTNGSMSKMGSSGMGSSRSYSDGPY